MQKKQLFRIGGAALLATAFLFQPQPATMESRIAREMKLSQKRGLAGDVEKIRAAVISTQLGIAQAYAAQSYYPIDLVTILKQFTDPLSSSGNCDSGGMIASVNCHLSKMGVTGPGSYTMADESGYYFLVTAGASSDSAYEYLVEAWVDSTAKNGTAKKKFMNYYFGSSGAKGKMEMFPELPGGQANEFALRLVWDGSVATAKTLEARMIKRANTSSTAWADREHAMIIGVTIDESADQGYGVFGMNGKFDGTNLAAFKLMMARNSTHTLVQGTICDPTDVSTCSTSTNIGMGSNTPITGSYQCVNNSTKDAGEDEATLGAIDNAGNCAALKSILPSSFSSSQMPVEANLNLFGTSDDAVFSLDEAD